MQTQNNDTINFNRRKTMIQSTQFKAGFIETTC